MFCYMFNRFGNIFVICLQHSFTYLLSTVAIGVRPLLGAPQHLQPHSLRRPLARASLRLAWRFSTTQPRRQLHQKHLHRHPVPW